MVQLKTKIKVLLLSDESTYRINGINLYHIVSLVSLGFIGTQWTVGSLYVVCTALLIVRLGSVFAIIPGGGGGGGPPPRIDGGGGGPGGGGGGGGAGPAGGGGGGGGGAKDVCAAAAVPVPDDPSDDSDDDESPPLTSLALSSSKAAIFCSSTDCLRLESSSRELSVFRRVEYSLSTYEIDRKSASSEKKKDREDEDEHASA